MKNEIFEFLQKNENSIDSLINDSKLILTQSSSKNIDEVAYILLNLLNTLDVGDITSSNLGDDCKNQLSIFLKEEKGSITTYLRGVKQTDSPKLIDIEWKFVGTATLDNNYSEFSPKIILKLQFSNGDSKVIETDFANFKKLQEDLEEGLLSYNSVYAKRVESFAK
jgi:hypothetical protein